jgi:hypothetical protein
MTDDEIERTWEIIEELVEQSRVHVLKTALAEPAVPFFDPVEERAARIAAFFATGQFTRKDPE